MTLHIFKNLDQGTEEWHAARRGIVTASVVGQLVTSALPDPRSVACYECGGDAGLPCINRSRKTPTYIKTVHDARRAAVADLPPVLIVADDDTSRGTTMRLVAERVAGFTEDTPMTSDMWRGVESEPIARDIYSGYYQQAVEVGFMRRDEDGWTLGYSPDGLVGDDGLIEIKAPRAKSHLQTILADEVPARYMPQLQAGLLVSGRKWVDFISYCGGMALYVKRVLPDSRWFDAITAAVTQFETTAAEMCADYETKTKGLPKTERVDNNLGLEF